MVYILDNLGPLGDWNFLVCPSSSLWPSSWTNGKYAFAPDLRGAPWPVRSGWHFGTRRDTRKLNRWFKGAARPTCSCVGQIAKGFRRPSIKERTGYYGTATYVLEWNISRRKMRETRCWSKVNEETQIWWQPLTKSAQHSSCLRLVAIELLSCYHSLMAF